jgi:hypothetical protein
MMADAAAEPGLRFVSVEPADGAAVGPIDRVVVSFDRPIDAFSLGFDTRVERPDDPTFIPIQVWSELGPDDPTKLVVNLGAALAPGRYQVVLASGSFLMGQAGEPLEGFGQDQVLATFEIAAAVEPPSAQTAIDLGRLNATERAVEGHLDPATGMVAVYRVELTPNHTWWRLGLEVESRRDGEGLSSSLAVFDAGGNLVARSGPMGRPGSSQDAYMFAGLAPGTYFVGVSEAGNRAGEPGAYDLSGTRPGPSGGATTGGSYTMRFVADPAEGPVQVLGFALDHADPADPKPTGFQVQFTGPPRVEGEGGSLAETIGGGLQLVDQNGRVTPLVAVKYDEAQAALTYVFERELPAGVYSVRVADQGGLTDLAGHAPLRAGLPAGVLARFRVSKADSTRGPLDFGAQYPEAIRHGHRETLTVPPGAEIGLRFVTLFDGFATTTLSHDGGALAVELVNLGTGAVDGPLDLGAPGTTRTNLDYLERGPHLLRLKATGDTPVVVTVGLQFGGFSYESLLLNGVGQGPALGLRVVSPVAVLGLDAVPGPSVTETPSSSFSPGGPETAAVNPLAASMAAASVIGTQMLPGVGTTSPVLVPGGGSTVLTMAAPGGLALSVGGVPIGLPGPSLTASSAPGSMGLATLEGQGQQTQAVSVSLGQGVDGATSPSVAVSWSLTPETEGATAASVAEAEEGAGGPSATSEPTGFWGRLEALARLMVSDRLDQAQAPAVAAGGGGKDQANAHAEAVASVAIQPTAPAVEAASLAPGGWANAIARSEAAADGDDPDLARPDAVAILSVLILTILPFRDRLARWVGRGGRDAHASARKARARRSSRHTVRNVSPGLPGTRLAV